ncbi:MAG: 3-phosphoshikimate 1-carboxyvinyltransferase [Planctomycetes bacterium]|nr:3-phosphoshikimate 1-carboxyvinyltransferase [Planctomycetota bacterium]
MGTDVRIRRSGAFEAEVQPPGSKSLTNRHLLCAALADGRSTLRGASLSQDGLAMMTGLRQLGVAVEVQPDRQTIIVSGCRGHFPADEAELSAGDAGTAGRFITALACLGYGRFRVDGSPRMRERPLGPLVTALHELGAQIGYDLVTGCLPVTIVARGLAGGQVTLTDPPSSQFVSALLMVAPYAVRDVLIRVQQPLPSRPYVYMTMAVMRSLGVEVLESQGQRFVVPATQRYAAGEIAIEPDASGASYFWAAAAVTGGRARVRGLSLESQQGDVHVVELLERMGCQVQAGPDFIEVQGPPSGQLRGIAEDLNAMPDMVQTLAIVALFATGPTRIDNVANLRIKETDRLAALATQLTRLGAQVDVREDGLTILPPRQITPAAIETYNDHRMAMSFAVAGLATDGIVIRDADCVAKSFPDFFDILGTLRGGSE